MDFSQLSMFLTLAQCRQFSEAAEKENISQSSLSKHIKALEEEIGAKLFRRSAKGAELTAAGKEFYTFSQNSLDAKRHMLLNITTYIEAQNKSTTVGVMPVMASYGIAKLFADFCREFPQFSIKIIEKSTREVVRLLAENSLNMALIGVGLADLDKYNEYVLAKDEIFLAVASDHPLAKHLLIDLKSLAEEPFILLEESVGLNHIIFEACKRAGFIPNISYKCSTVPSALSMVKEGLGALLLTSKGINAYNTSGIKLVRLQDKLFGQLVLVTRKEYDLNQADIAFRNFTLNWYNITDREL